MSLTSKKKSNFHKHPPVKSKKIGFVLSQRTTINLLNPTTTKTYKNKVNKHINLFRITLFFRVATLTETFSLSKEGKIFEKSYKKNIDTSAI